MLSAFGNLIIFAAVFSGAPVLAQPLTSLPVSGTKPVSVSYQNLTQCFPELESDSLSSKVELNRLKDLIDEKFITSGSALRQRRIRYVDASGQAMNLILRTKPITLKKSKTELTLQKVDDKGVLIDLALTDNQRTNPKQEILNGFLLNGTIKGDESTYFDTKLNGVDMRFTRNFKDVIDLTLEDKPRKRSVNCYSQADLGIICTCSKK